MQDYNFTETALTMLYSPLNFYCYVIDRNATDTFKEKVIAVDKRELIIQNLDILLIYLFQMRFLSLCVHNVIVPDIETDGSDPEDFFQGNIQSL